MTNEDIDTREINIRLMVYEVGILIKSLKSDSMPWYYSNPILLKCHAQLQQFEQMEKERETQRIRGTQKQKNAEIESLATKKAEEKYNIKIAELKEKEKKRKSKKRKKSRR
ncbi:unnamed protein product [marine sediment metagenome]|uniref:Uncharacterized protein n=1 Tax=marine sediment metagenome TaxID=412755 RepID=X0WPG8_9ZZZZ